MQQANETTEQQAVIEWSLYSRGRFPALKNLYHVPNEGKRSRAAGGIAKSLGLCPGVPDLILDYPAGRYHGCRIEMKYGKNKPTKDQEDWLKRLAAAGYFVAVCWSASAAIALLTEYCSLTAGASMKEDRPELTAAYGVPAMK